MSDEQADTRTAAELRHRMANTFQLMSALARMRGQRASEPEARRQLVWMADAIGSLGALERHRQEAGIDFAAYLADMAPVWQRRQGTRPAEIQLSCAQLHVSDQAASTLALIAQELIANALAHGYPDARAGVVKIGLKRLDDDRCELTVVDDGQGFDPAAPGARERFGLWFVRSLAAQVRGEFVLDCQAGVAARLVFSL
ncbi:MAG: sensor histidine kinase [Phenylobacterium sp.]|uniref:sensor histidine kinase n=1 Tax=Phenylobacterium sp. TaxID=1871053 RepID=UPI002735EEF3|nr:sensor histidine kinase [Phenylobacterium sp.]MDP3747110.1 sensor histidine kinase [Phenylobacterium sp.]